MNNNASRYFLGQKTLVGTEQVVSPNRVRNARIFLGVAIALYVTAIIMFCLEGIMFGIESIMLGTPFLVCFFIFRKGLVNKGIYQDSMTGTEYDRLVLEMLAAKQHDARDYLGIDESEIEEIEPISLEGYNFEKCTKYKKDEFDSFWRTDLYEKVTLFFTKNEVHVYKCMLDIMQERITETTSVYFYEDVVSVSTDQERYSKGGVDIEYISFKLETRGSSKISVALKGDNTNQRSINAMRAMIKEKKSRL